MLAFALAKKGGRSRSQEKGGTNVKLLHKKEIFLIGSAGVSPVLLTSAIISPALGIYGRRTGAVVAMVGAFAQTKCIRNTGATRQKCTTSASGAGLFGGARI